MLDYILNCLQFFFCSTTTLGTPQIRYKPEVFNIHWFRAKKMQNQ